MHKKSIVSCLIGMLGIVTGAAADGVEGPKVTSWSNNITGDQKTVFRIKPGENITFTVKAEGAQEYQWLVNNVIQEKAKGNSFTWTAPGNKGIWKILARTTNKTRRQWVQKQVVFWDKWVKVTKDRRGKTHSEKKQAFIQGMIENRLYPLKARKEWIVSAFLKEVKPGESIQKAIDSVPPEGGIVELAPGTHEINEEMYPTQTFRCFYKNRLVKYSIIIKKNYVTVYGPRKAIVRHHDKTATCFFIPDLEGTDPNLYVENVTFRGFTTTSAYTRKDGPRNSIISASHVKNFTVEDMHDTSWARCFTGAGARYRRYSENVYIKNNLMEHCGLGFSHIRNIHVINNVILGSRSNYALATDERLSNMFVMGNRVINAGANSGLLVDGPNHCLMSDNFVRGSQESIRISQSVYQAIIENNTFTGATRNAIGMRPQGAMRRVLIRNNRIYGNRGNGVWAGEYGYGMSGVSDAVLINNTIYNNGGDGVKIDSEHWGPFTIRNNIILNNKGFGINRKRGKLIHSHNNVWNNDKGDYNECNSGLGEFSKDPIFADPSKGDFHLKSKAGRWDPKTKKWVKDDVQSPCIDTGNPKAGCSREPAPNGGRMNLGAYGNTAEASKSIKK